MKYIAIILASVFIISCSDSEPKKGTKLNKDNASHENKIEVVNDAQLQRIINQRNGKALFLNVWATWCVPCVEEFPDIVKINENYKNKDLEVIAVSVDLPSDINEKIIPFLKKQQAAFRVYVAEEKSSDEIINMLNTEWSGAVPVTFIFDKSGRQQKYLYGAQNYNQFSSAVDSVISM